MLRSWRIAGGPKDNRDIEGTSPLTSFGALRAMPSPASYGRVRFDLTNQSKNGRARRRRRGRERFADSQTSPHLFPCPPFPPCPPCDAFPLLLTGEYASPLPTNPKTAEHDDEDEDEKDWELARRPLPTSSGALRTMPFDRSLCFFRNPVKEVLEGRW
jgi:hypothetical protein